MILCLAVFKYAPAQVLKNQSELPIIFTDSNGKYCEWENWGFKNIPEYLCTCNNLDAARTTQTNSLWPLGSLGLNLSGSGMNKLGIWDGGRARTSHIEFGTRIQIMDSNSTLSSHTTAVAGNLMAAGLNPNVRGMSYETQLKNWNFTNDNSEIISAAPLLLLSNHSYASTSAWTTIGGQIYWYGDSSLHPTRDWKFGYYDNRSRIWDSVMYVNPYYLMVKASGNDRGNGIAPGTPHYYWNGSAWALSTSIRDSVGPYDCISTFGNAKNIICVGAIQAVSNGLSGNNSTLSFSTWGPTDDGRIKPDLVASSGNILSVGSSSDSSYSGLGGTSIAAPNVTGSLLLLQQYFHQINGRYLYNSTLKALAIHSARRCQINLPGPDYSCGWGIPNFSEAAKLISDSVKNRIIEFELVNQDSFITYVYLTPADTLRSTLVWTDPKGITSPPAYNDSSLKLVNDLDMRLFSLNDSLIEMPFVLNPNQPQLPATTGDNFRDNVEQIFKTNLPNSWYKIKIKHKGNLQNNLAQRFSLITTGANNLQALPVTYLNFGARLGSPNEIILNWSTSQETNNFGFDILHGNGHSTLSKIAHVKGRGNSNQKQYYHYAFKNKDAFTGVHYFQINQRDFDGKNSLSPILNLTIDNPSQIESIIPNPFSKQFTLFYQSNHSCNLKIIDLNGKTIYSKTIDANQNGKEVIELENQLPGLYFLMLEPRNNYKTETYKILKY